MVDSPRLPNAAPQGNPAASKASPSGALPGAEQRRVATFLSQEGSQGSFALGGRRFKASLQGAPLRPGDQLLVEGGGEGKPLQVRELLRKEGQSLKQVALDRLWRGAAGRDQSPRSVSQKASQSTFSDPRLQGLAQGLRALSSQLPALSLNALSANSLRAALEESGIFFEGKLKAGQAPAPDRSSRFIAGRCPSPMTLIPPPWLEVRRGSPARTSPTLSMRRRSSQPGQAADWSAWRSSSALRTRS